MQIRKEEVKLSLFANDVILYSKILKILLKNLRSDKQVEQSGKIKSTEKSAVFPYTSSDRLRKKSGK
jgi:hypothetical protein